MEVKEIVEGVKTVVGEKIKEVKDSVQTHTTQIKDLSEAIDGIKKVNGRIGSRKSIAEPENAKDLVSDSFAEKLSEIQSVNSKFPLRYELKVAGNITVSNVGTTGTASNLPYSYSDFGIVTRPRRKVTIRDLVRVIPTQTGAFTYYRQPYTGSIGQGSFGFQAGQGNLKPLLDKTLQQVIVNADYLAGTARVSKQMLQDLPTMQSFLAEDLLEDYRRAESDAFIPPLLAAATSYTPASTVTAEKIVQATADLMSRDWNPNGIITDALTWAKIMNTKPADYGLPGGGTSFVIDSDGNARFLGMPILVCNNMTPGQVLVGDFTKAAIIQAAGLTVNFYEQDQDNVSRNLVTCLIEARVGFTVMRPDAFDIFTSGTT